MNFLKQHISKQKILVAAAIIICAAAIWFFKNPLTANLFNGKEFTQIPIINRGILVVISMLIGSLILYNLFEYLFPDNLYDNILAFIRARHASTSDSRTPEPSTPCIQMTAGVLFNALAAAYLSIFVLALQEWIFLVTKESFMDALPWSDRLGVLVQSAWILSVFVFILILLLWLAASLIKTPLLHQAVWFIFRLIPALILAAAALLIFDNFTYIMLGFGIVDSYSIYRASYGLAFLLFVNKTYTKIRLSATFIPLKTVSLVAIILFAIGTVSTTAGMLTRTSEGSTLIKPNPTRTPNIILIGSDGVTANHLPMYGYERDTTPFMSTIVEQALVADSNYSQTGSSWGSLISIFTGKLPTRTRVVNLPDALIGDDSYQHLPGILKEVGYTSIDITYERYANASLANVRNGFDRINGKDMSTNPLITSLGKILPVNSQYNLDLLMERISDRVKHIFFIQIMPNPFKEVNTLTGRKDATSRIPELLDYVNHGDQPFFIHVHLLGTHGPNYKTTSTTFSQGREQTKDFEVDFYDDAIVDFDTYIRDLFTALDDTGKLDNTVVVIYSDHPRKRAAYQHVPLIFWFPAGEHAGRINLNTENLDIAPTLLDYMGIDAPDWMEGVSIISGALDPARPIFSVIWKSPKKNKPENMAFDQFAAFRLVVCDRYVEFSTTKMAWDMGDVDDVTGVCSSAQVLPFESNARHAHRTSQAG